jgi:hypothetical protein
MSGRVFAQGTFGRDGKTSAKSAVYPGVQVRVPFSAIQVRGLCPKGVRVESGLAHTFARHTIHCEGAFLNRYQYCRRSMLLRQCAAIDHQLSTSHE